MLVGLPENAVLITNGDYDTFPLLALQAGMAFRTDVAVINQWLLGIPAFAEAIFERYPKCAPRGDAGAKKGPESALELIGEMVRERSVPVYVSTTVIFENLGLGDTPIFAEGLSWRTSQTGLAPEEIADLFLNTYRLDSATDWNFAWRLVPSISRLVGNYVTGMLYLVREGDLDAATKRRILARAREIAEFHRVSRYDEGEARHRIAERAVGREIGSSTVCLIARRIMRTTPSWRCAPDRAMRRRSRNSTTAIAAGSRGRSHRSPAQTAICSMT
jgi:hypothetical protein